VTVGLDFSGTAGLGTNYSATDTSIVIGSGQSAGAFTLTGIDSDITTDQDVAVASTLYHDGATVGSRRRSTPL